MTVICTCPEGNLVSQLSHITTVRSTDASDMPTSRHGVSHTRPCRLPSRYAEDTFHIAGPTGELHTLVPNLALATLDRSDTSIALHGPKQTHVMSDAITPGGHLLVVGQTAYPSTRQPELKLIGTKPDAEHTGQHYVSVVFDVPSVTSIINI